MADGARPRRGSIATAMAAAVIILAALAATYLRFGLVEATDVAAGCLAYGKTGLACTLRAATIAIFNVHGFGTTALVLAAWAFWRPNTVIMTLGFAAAVVGLVLYETGLSALAAAILILAFARLERAEA